MINQIRKSFVWDENLGTCNKIFIMTIHIVEAIFKVLVHNAGFNTASEKLVQAR